jgi:secretion/DNA translocation related TadE-like protein
MAACELNSVLASRAAGLAMSADDVLTPALGRGRGLTAPAHGRGPISDERGSVTVVMIGVIAVVLVMTTSGLLLTSAVLASHRARAASDLAALAAAGALMRGGPASEACQLAARVAAVNHARIHQCTAAGTEVRLSVTVPASVSRLGVATARSRAGPGASE